MLFEANPFHLPLGLFPIMPFSVCPAGFHPFVPKISPLGSASRRNFRTSGRKPAGQPLKGMMGNRPTGMWKGLPSQHKLLNLGNLYFSSTKIRQNFFGGKFFWKIFENFFFSKKFPSKKISYTPPTWNFGGWEKKFFSILFHISKCTLWAIKMTPSKSWYHLWLSHNNGLFL